MYCTLFSVFFLILQDFHNFPDNLLILGHQISNFSNLKTSACTETSAQPKKSTTPVLTCMEPLSSCWGSKPATEN